jgi:hypothetical protein
MKKIVSLSLLSLMLILLSCKKEEQEPDTIIVKQERGYVCENFTCKFVETGATYVTLLDCKSECADTRPGSLEMKVNYTQYGGQFGSVSTVTINIFESVEDMSVNVPAKSKVESTTLNGPGTQTQTITFKVDDFIQGKYYYAVYLRRDYSSGVELKTGFAKVEVNKTTTVDLSF